MRKMKRTASTVDVVETAQNSRTGADTENIEKLFRYSD